VFSAEEKVESRATKRELEEISSCKSMIQVLGATVNYGGEAEAINFSF
jgi:hypothetical protein